MWVRPGIYFVCHYQNTIIKGGLLQHSKMNTHGKNNRRFQQQQYQRQYNYEDEQQQPSVNFKNDKTGTGAIELESLIRQCHYLYNSYEERFSILLSEAELRLHENSEAKKFQNMEKQIKKHITQWHKMSRDLSQIAISSRDHMNKLSVQMQTLTEEIQERDKIIQTERAENTHTIQEYENQLKILENVIAKSLPNNMRVQQIQQWMNAGMEDDFQVCTHFNPCMKSTQKHLHLENQ